MTRLIRLFICSLFVFSTAQAREIIHFNSDWSFARFGIMPDGTTVAEPKGLQAPDFDDSDWRVLNLPHDWGIEGPFRPELPNQTGKLPWAGIGWYRKHFQCLESDLSGKIFIEFDGAMSGTTVYVNGGYVGEWPYGYSSFHFDISHYIKPGQNTIAVRLDNKPNSSRWYPGGGIYRNVRLVKTAPTHIDHWGIFITTPEVTEEHATVHVQTKLVGIGEIHHEVYEYDSNILLASGRGADCDITLKNPTCWNLDTPHLYTLKTIVKQHDRVMDEVENTFGVRTIEYTPAGFFLNGQKVRMNGVCEHHHLGPLGAAVNRRAIERKIEILKSFGVNAIRTAHNPPAPELLELCDRMGVLVQVEAFDVWKKGKVENDYSSLFGAWHERDLRAMARRDRNHPCVVMWSTGNEMIELRSGADAPMAAVLADIIRSEDPTRPTTFGNSRPEAATNGFHRMADVFGFNYKPHLYEEFRKTNPDIPLYGSETVSCLASRGEYFFPVEPDNPKAGAGGHFQVSSYGYSAPHWSYPPDVEFKAQDQHPWVFGQFVWTGFDYIGEPTPFNNDKTNLLNFTDPAEKERMKAELKKLGSAIPPRSSYFGIVDLCGFPKDIYYLYQSQWMPDLPMAHILPHWNWPERVGETTPVIVYTSGDSAELFLNGKSLGVRTKGPFEYRLCWMDTVYEPGTLKVVVTKNGKPWAEAEMKTTGPAEKLSLSADRSNITADGQDLSFVTVDVTDSEGLVVPRTHNSVQYSLSGPGEIIAVGNGDPTSHEPFQTLERKVFNGKALVIIRSFKNKPGTITLTAQSAGLAPASVSIVCQ